MGMMFRRNKLRQLEAQEQVKAPAAEKAQEPMPPVSVKDKVPEVKRRGRKPKE